MSSFPDFPEVSSDFEYAYALSYLQSVIRKMHTALDGLSVHDGLCKDLRQIPVDMAQALEQRRKERKADK